LATGWVAGQRAVGMEYADYRWCTRKFLGPPAIDGTKEVAVGTAAVTIGSMMIVDGFSSILRGQSVFGPRGLNTLLGTVPG
jgi:hypothetical protein